MAKKVKAMLTLQLPAGKANPAPPVGPALAQHGINLMQFCKDYNAKTGNRIGEIVPAEITVYQDGSFKFRLKSPPTAFLIRKEAGIPKGSSVPNRDKVGKLTMEQVRKIAQEKMNANDVNAFELDQAVRQVMGTCRSMGVEVIPD